MDDRKFYIIIRNMRATGIGETVCGVAAQSIYATEKGMIPIVDMMHSPNQYYKDGRIFKDNTWEYFFNQPAGYSLDAINDGDCILSRNSIYPDNDYRIAVWDLPVDTFLAPDININLLKNKYREYINFNDDTQNYILNVYNNVIKGNENILGVLVRGTDYIVRKTKDEQIQPKPKTVIKKVKLFLKKHPDINKIYIATEDEVIYQQFKREFGEILIDNGQYRYNYKEKNMPLLADIKTNRPNHNYTLAKEYLSSLYILSKCKYFIGGRCAGTKIAWILSDGWEDVYIWDLGRYGHLRFNPFKYFFGVNK